ncbi:hypothetical protein RJ641_030064 [Dillenia turbinata]|uniref:Uncharacterized protein n=1 Tax=Dillenia turbinata TaxID=194707 RepID=A0AAN8ZN95_9MAGN
MAIAAILSIHSSSSTSRGSLCTTTPHCSSLNSKRRCFFLQYPFSKSNSNSNSSLQLCLSRPVTFRFASSCVGVAPYVVSLYDLLLQEVEQKTMEPGLLTKSLQHEGAENYGAAGDHDPVDRKERDGDGGLECQEHKSSRSGTSFLVVLAIALGIAAIATAVSIGLQQPALGSSFGVQILADSSSAALISSPVGFSFKAFGYRFILPEYTPGWIYFWLLMAAGCGLFISEEALNIWVGMSLARMLSLDGAWQSFADSFSRNAPYMLSTIVWVYWGVCISDMVPFYLGKLFRQSGASENVRSKVRSACHGLSWLSTVELHLLGIGEEKALSITQAVQKYGNLIGFVERFSFGVRNPTAFLAGALGISPEYFFAGVCCGGLITLPIQLGIGFLLREHPVVALATVATAVGIWTAFPYAVAALTALFLYLRSRYST